MNTPTIQVFALKGGGWRVTVRVGADGVFLWQRKALTLADLRLRLDGAALVRSVEVERRVCVPVMHSVPK